MFCQGTSSLIQSSPFGLGIPLRCGGSSSELVLVIPDLTSSTLFSGAVRVVGLRRFKSILCYIKLVAPSKCVLGAQGLDTFRRFLFELSSQFTDFLLPGAEEIERGQVVRVGG